jgi:hypothetical protein
VTETPEQTAEKIAARGREALISRLRPAFEEAAAAHSDVLKLGPDQIEAMVQRAADRADGLQWRRALAHIATEELGISLGEALSHPAVSRAHEIVGAPSYEDSLAELGPIGPRASTPASPPVTAAATAAAEPAADAAPAAEPEAAEPEAAEPDAEPDADHEHEGEAADAEPAADADEQPEHGDEADDGGADESEEPDREAGSTDAEAEADDEAPEHAVADDEDAHAEDEDEDAGGAPSEAESVADDAPEAAAAEAPELGESGFASDAEPSPRRGDTQVFGVAPAVGEVAGEEPAPVAAPPGATAEFPFEEFEDDFYEDGLRISVIHLGGIANLEPAEGNIELLMSADGLDIIRAGNDVLGRLEWDQVKALEVPLPRGRRRVRRPGPTHLVIRTARGDASFEVPDVSATELRQHLAPVIDDHLRRA